MDNANNWREKSLKYSFWDGIFTALMTGFTANYVLPFALALRATNFHIAILSSLPILFASLIQLTSAGIQERFKNRVKIVTFASYLQAIFIIPILFIPVFFKDKSYSVGLFIFFIMFSGAMSAVGSPVWSSLMSETVPKEGYGKYFAWRGKILGFIAIGSGFIAGLILDLFYEFTGFIIIFMLATICRFISGYFNSKMTDIPITINEEDKFTYIDFVKRLPKSNFAKFAFYIALMHFSIFLAAPFFGVYMLKELQFNYTTYTIIILSGAIISMLSLPFWGYYSDKIGNAKIVKICFAFNIILPVLWVFSSNVIYLIVINVVGGYLWSGFALAMGNFIFDAVKETKRVRAIAYFNVTVGVFLFIGAILGGYLIQYLPEIKESKLLTIFVISGILRLIIYGFLSRTFHEVRKTEPIDERKFFMIILWLKPILNTFSELFNFFRPRKG
ncbi:MAG: MFS transporter [Actinobacteria bacterium]|nr:MFS transporter [Actinomycetota bacterium]